MSEVRMQLRAVTVPRTERHEARGLEIAKLPRFLEAVSLFAPTLGFLNTGEAEPDADRSQFPWMKSEDGVPLGMFVKIGGSWVPAVSKYFIKAAEEDLLIQHALETITVSQLREIKQTTDFIVFDEAFDEVPDVFTVLIGGTLLDQDGIWNETKTDLQDMSGITSLAWPVSKVPDQFKISCRTGVDTDTVSQTLEVYWIAIGRKAN